MGTWGRNLPSTEYEALDFSTLNASNLINAMNRDVGTINSTPFVKFLSAASGFKSYPDLASCSLYSVFNGRLAVLLPAAALTAKPIRLLTSSSPAKP